MARYLLDTTALIDFSKGREPAQSQVLQWISSGDELGVCAVNVAEFYSGLDPADHAGWDQFFQDLLHWPITPPAARQAGIWRYQFRRQGVQLATTDVLIAAVAREQQAVLVTSNVKDYPMAGLQLLPLT